jgi:HSP20 family protein
MHGIGAGAFSCSFTLPDYADRDKSVASYKQGLLSITFPKREEAKPRSIMIESR